MSGRGLSSHIRRAVGRIQGCDPPNANTPTTFGGTRPWFRPTVLKYAKRLKDSGVPDKQAEVLEVNLKYLATKEDLRCDLRELEQRMVIKLGGIMMAAIAIVATLVKLL